MSEVIEWEEVPNPWEFGIRDDDVGLVYGFPLAARGDFSQGNYKFVRRVVCTKPNDISTPGFAACRCAKCLAEAK